MNAAFDLSGADPNGQFAGGDLIPRGTLAWAIVSVRPLNLDQGKVAKTSDKGNIYVDLELTIEQGQHARRKVWTMVGLGGSEKYAAMGLAALRHIVEVGRGMDTFQPGDPRYQLGPQSGTNGDMALMELDGMRCAIRVGVEIGTGQYQGKDKNTVEAFLSPNPQSNTNKDFVRLVAGDTEPKAPTRAVMPGAGAAAGAASPSWASKPQGAPASMPAGNAAGWQGNQAQQRQAAQPQGRPSWAGPAPAKDDKVPF